jgi:hypothetical protein
VLSTFFVIFKTKSTFFYETEQLPITFTTIHLLLATTLLLFLVLRIGFIKDKSPLLDCTRAFHAKKADVCFREAWAVLQKHPVVL